MRSWRPHLIAIGLVACLAMLVGTVETVEAGQAGDDPDGLIRYQLTLGARQISVAYEPALRADDPALAALLAWSPGAAQSAVRVGRLEGHRALSIGTLAPDLDVPRSPGPSHDLWLTRTEDGWALDARPPIPDEPDDSAESDDPDEPNDPADPDDPEDPEDADDPEDPDDKDAEDAEEAEDRPAPPPPRVSGRISLTHRPRTGSADSLTLTLAPDGEDSGQLTLLWGLNSWTTDFEFVTLPRRPRPERTSNVGRATNLTRDSDTSARYRGATLGTRNETALVTPDGAHIQILFQKELGTDGDDYAALESIADGGLVQLTRGAVIRLRTEVPLRFTDTLVPTDNLAPDFPGSYGLWLKKTGMNWRLVFNNEPDSWGTQHDPAFDAADITLTHVQGGPSDGSDGDEDGQPLAVYLAPRDDGQIGLVIQWGEHVWAADFSVTQ